MKSNLANESQPEEMCILIPFISLARINSSFVSYTNKAITEGGKMMRWIDISIRKRELRLYDGNRVLKKYPIGVGRMVTATPVGTYKIINKQLNPGGPFGAFWMGLSRPHYGIHGTNNPSSIGKFVSHGCIRMHNEDVLELSSLVLLGTTVKIHR